VLGTSLKSWLVYATAILLRFLNVGELYWRFLVLREQLFLVCIYNDTDFVALANLLLTFQVFIIEILNTLAMRDFFPMYMDVTSTT